MGSEHGTQPARWPTLAAFQRDVMAVRGPQWTQTRVRRGRLEGVVATPQGWLEDPSEQLQAIVSRLDPVREPPRRYWLPALASLAVMMLRRPLASCGRRPAWLFPHPCVCFRAGTLQV